VGYLAPYLCSWRRFQDSAWGCQGSHILLTFFLQMQPR
jgi:hypothetical protein